MSHATECSGPPWTTCTQWSHKTAGHSAVVAPRDYISTGFVWVSTGLWCFHKWNCQTPRFSGCIAVHRQNTTMCVKGRECYMLYWWNKVRDRRFYQRLIHLIPSLFLSFCPRTHSRVCHVKFLKVLLSFSSQIFHVAIGQLCIHHSLLFLWGKSAIENAFIEVICVFICQLLPCTLLFISHLELFQKT